MRETVAGRDAQSLQYDNDLIELSKMPYHVTRVGLR